MDVNTEEVTTDRKPFAYPNLPVADVVPAVVDDLCSTSTLPAIYRQEYTQLNLSDLETKVQIDV